MLLNTAFPEGLICYMSKEKTEQLLFTPLHTPVEPIKYLRDFFCCCWGFLVVLLGWVVCFGGGGFLMVLWGFLVFFLMLLWDCVPTEWMTPVPSL